MRKNSRFSNPKYTYLYRMAEQRMEKEIEKEREKKPQQLGKHNPD